jgi:hypothetical protein
MLSSHMSGILRERPPRCQTIVSARNRKTPLRSMSLDVVRAALQGELGEPDHGFLLVCNSDFPFAEGLGRDIKLTRTQTLMQGASHCDFRYKWRKD